MLAICNWIQTEWFKLYCEYTYEKKEKTKISGDNTGLLERLILDATDVGVGAVLLQEGKDDIDLPNCYLSLKFDKDHKK